MEFWAWKPFTHCQVASSFSTLQPKPSSLHFETYTPHSTLYTLHPTPYGFAVAGLSTIGFSGRVERVEQLRVWREGSRV